MLLVSLDLHSVNHVTWSTLSVFISDLSGIQLGAAL